MKKKLLCSFAICMSCVMILSAFCNREGFLFANEAMAQVVEETVNDQTDATEETSDDKTVLSENTKEAAKEVTPVSEEKEMEDQMVPVTLTSEIHNGVKVVVQGDSVTLANGKKVLVEELPKAELVKVNTVLETVLQEESEIQAYDITLKDDKGNIIQPAGEVKVSFVNIEQTQEVDVYHVDPDHKNVENMKAIQAKDGSLSFETTHFSTYVLRTPMPRVTDPIGDIETLQIEMRNYPYTIYAYGFANSIKIHVYGLEDTKTYPANNGSFYRFNTYNMQIPLEMGLLSNTYEIEKVVTKKLGFMNYDKNTVANGTLLPVNEGKVTLHLTGDNKGADFIDIYVKPKNPSKKTLILKNALDPTGLSAAEQETELKKTYKYQLFDAHTNEPIKQMLSYDLIIDGKATSLTTLDDGILRAKVGRELQIDVTKFSGQEVYIKQLSGARYETSIKMNDENFKVSSVQKSTGFVASETLPTMITYKNKRLDIDDLVEHNKTSTIVDWEKRTYNIHLSAGYKNNEVTTVENMDVQFVLDTSGSMLSTDAATPLHTLNDVNKLNKKAIYFTKPYKLTQDIQYSQGITFTAFDNEAEYTKQIKECLASHFYQNGNVYGVISTDNNTLLFYDNTSEEWKYIDIKKNGTVSTSGAKTLTNEIVAKYPVVYCDRSSVLIDAVSSFVKGMNADSNVSIITFGNNATDVTKGFVNVGKNKEELLQTILKCSGTPYQGTNMADGLTMAKKQIDNTPSSNNCYSIVFSDGAPSLPKDIAEQAAVDAAKALKKVSLTYAVCAGEADKDFMKNKIASSPDQFLSTDNMTDIYDLLQIISDEVGAASIHAKITDYIDPHFTLIDEQGNPLHVGDKILGGEGIIGTVGQDENGWFVTWENQLITTGDSTWSVNIKVQAKDAFMGNNEVTTNGNGSQIEIPDGDTTKIIEFDKPVVNVKELTLTGGENSEIIFYGEEEDYAAIFENKRPAFTASGEVTIPPLTSDEFKQLLSDDATKIEKTYSFDDRKAGIFLYSVETKGDSKTILCTYIPNTESDEEYTTNRVSAKWVYTLKKVKGQLDITKTIKEAYTSEKQIKANQSFIFRIERRLKKEDEKPVEVFYQAINFSANTNETSKTISVKGLKKGYYTVIEETNWSWKYQLVAQSDNDEQNITNNELLFIGQEHGMYYGVEEGTKIADIKDNPRKSYFTNNLNNTLKDVIGDVAAAINLLN